MIHEEPDAVVSASLQKIKSIKNPIKHFLLLQCSQNQCLMVVAVGRRGGGQGGRCYNDVVTVLTEPVLDGSDSGKGVGVGGGGGGQGGRVMTMWLQC